MSCSCSSCARRRDESLLRGKGAIEWSRRESMTRRYRDEHRTARARTCTDTFHECAIAFLSTVHPRHDSTSASSHDQPFIFDDRLRFLRLVCVLALGTPRCVHFASLHAARHRTNRSTRAYLRGDLAMVRATKPARASPRAFAKRAAAPRLPDSRFLSLAAFSRRDVAKTQRASTGASSRGETRARRNESARVLRVPAPRARATLVHSTTYRAPLTEAHPPNRARTR